MANFAANAPDLSAIKKAESKMATLERKARAAKAAAEKFQQGRQKGAVSNLTRALQEIVRAARSKEMEAVLAKIDEYIGEDIQGCIRFDGFDELDNRIEYTDLTKNRANSIAIDSLKRRLRALPDV